MFSRKNSRDIFPSGHQLMFSCSVMFSDVFMFSSCSHVLSSLIFGSCLLMFSHMLMFPHVLSCSYHVLSCSLVFSVCLHLMILGQKPCLPATLNTYWDNIIGNTNRMSVLNIYFNYILQKFLFIFNIFSYHYWSFSFIALFWLVFAFMIIIHVKDIFPDIIIQKQDLNIW